MTLLTGPTIMDDIWQCSRSNPHVFTGVVMVRRTTGSGAVGSSISLLVVALVGWAGIPDRAEAQQTTKQKMAKPATPAKGAATAKGANASTGWTVTADPPAEPIKVPTEAGYTIPVPMGQGVLYPPTPSNFVALGKNEKASDVRQVFDLRTKEVVGEIGGKHDFSREVKLSPDGQFLMTEGKPTAAQSRSIEIWSFKTGGLIQTIVASPTPAFIGLLGFARGNQAVTARYIGKGDLISVWDVETGKLAREVLGPPSFRREATAISPGGRYLALISNDPSLVVFDLTTAKKVGEKALPKSGSGYVNPEGLSFSPDGSELAGLFTSGTESKLWVWDVAKGTVVVDHTLKGNVKLNVPGAQSYKGRAIEWLPDGSAWLLSGHTIVDRAGGRPVWIFRSGEGDFYPEPRLLVDNDHMLTVGGPTDDRRLEVVALPWKQVDAALKAIEAKSPAYICPGQPVSLKIDIGDVRFGSADETHAGITKTLVERLQSEGIPVAEGQSAVLHIRYGEAAGETLREMKSKGPLPGFGGTPTGRTIQATKALCSISWELEGQKTPIWAEKLDFDPTNLMVSGEATDAKARESAFGVLKLRLAGVPLPYFVPKFSSLSTLPGVTVLSTAKGKPVNKATTKPTTRGKAKTP